MALGNDIKIKDQERRLQERVDDEILLLWREVQADEIPEEIANEMEATDDFSLYSQLMLLSMESGELLKRIKRVNPLFAEYLTILERKVDTLTNAVLSKDDIPQTHTTRHVNLSTSGLAFLTEKEFPIGTLLEMKMIFSPSQGSIIAYGRVIYCIHYDDDKPLSHRIGVGFIRMQDYDRKLLTNHVSSRISVGKAR